MYSMMYSASPLPLPVGGCFKQFQVSGHLRPWIIAEKSQSQKHVPGAENQRRPQSPRDATTPPPHWELTVAHSSSQLRPASLRSAIINLYKSNRQKSRTCQSLDRQPTNRPSGIRKCVCQSAYALQWLSDSVTHCHASMIWLKMLSSRNLFFS